jgi:hypothetical protein
MESNESAPFQSATDAEALSRALENFGAVALSDRGRRVRPANWAAPDEREIVGLRQ